MVWLTEHIKHSLFRALVIRKNSDDLSDWVDRATRFYGGLGVKIAYRPAEITFPSGAKIKTGHLKDDQAYTKYQGHEYQRMLVEELTQIPEEKRYLQLTASCRSTIPEIDPQIFATTNPGGVGHQWVKQRFVDPAPAGEPFKDKLSGRSRIFIPATVDDNPTLITADPDYIRTLDALKGTDEELWKAWRLGDWTTFAGQYFKEFRTDLHTCDYFEPKDQLTRVGGVDWGYSPRPFAYIGAAIENVIYVDNNDFEYRFNRLWIYKEIVGTEKTPHEWAREIKEKLKPYPQWIRSDPSMFKPKPDGSRSIADQFREENVQLLPADNHRIHGWVALHNWLSIAPDGLPYLIIGKQCHDLITNLPTLVHDETNNQDDSSDALRYLVIHTKWIDASTLGTVSRLKTKTNIPKHVALVDPTKFR